jgi:hypothetical protein
VYSNSAYDMLRILTAYCLARSPSLLSGSPYFYTLPPVPALESMTWQQRDFFTCLIHAKFVQEHVLKSCNAEGYLRPIADARYYDVSQPATSSDFEYTPSNSTLLTVGGGGWNMSANALRKFLVGLQQGKPFGGHASWWNDFMWKNYYGADCPWLSGQPTSTVQLPGGRKRRTFNKSGGESFPFLDGSGAKANARAQLFITRDATVALVLNSFDTQHKTRSLKRVIDDAYFAAVSGSP